MDYKSQFSQAILDRFVDPALRRLPDEADFWKPAERARFSRPHAAKRL